MMRQIYASAAQAHQLPTMVRLTSNLYGAEFRCMKILPALYILKRAEKRGHLPPKGIVIETTSGTFGLGLALACNYMSYRLILVSDPAIDPFLKQRLEELGAQVEIVTQPAEIGGFQGSRLARMAELQQQYPKHFWPSQYDNPNNPAAYAPLAELIVETVGKVDILVGTVGSGGSTHGTSKYLRFLFSELHLVGVDTHHSVLFGQPDGKRLLRGLGNSLMPKNVNHCAFNEIHWVSAAEAFHATRLLHRNHALYMGGTSGAAYMVARWLAENNPEKKVVCIFPDEGYRYQNTIYNDVWLKKQDLWLNKLPSSPILVSHPHQAATNGHWCRMNWERRRYE